jgi:hypothetical protein
MVIGCGENRITLVVMPAEAEIQDVGQQRRQCVLDSRVKPGNDPM